MSYSPAAQNGVDLDSKALAERFNQEGFCNIDSQELRDALDTLADKCNALRNQSNNYPANPIRGDVWIFGVGLVGLSRGVAARLRNAGLTTLELIARECAASAVCSVMAHYDHEVAPTMVDLGLCLERASSEDRAQSVFRAVSSDFPSILDELGGRSPSDEQEVALSALVTALERLKVRTPEDDVALARTRSVLRAQAP